MIHVYNLIYKELLQAKPVLKYPSLIKCAECGCYLTAEYKRGRNKKGHYIYYHCSNAKGKHTKLLAFT